MIGHKTCFFMEKYGKLSLNYPSYLFFSGALYRRAKNSEKHGGRCLNIDPIEYILFLAFHTYELGCWNRLDNPHVQGTWLLVLL